MKKKNWILAVLLFLIFVKSEARADYVVPYPSYMPGNKLYKLSRLVDELKKYWYWGSIGRIKYHMMLSDKYLIEAKTLFEYKQYLLGVDALTRSNRYFEPLSDLTRVGEREGEDMSELKKNIQEESLIHQKILKQLAGEVPEDFRWAPEKAKSTVLALGRVLNEAIVVRQNVGRTLSE